MIPLQNERNQAIAIIGVACRLPGGWNSPRRLWEALARGDKLASTAPSQRRFAGMPDRPPIPTGAEAIFLDEIDMFDAAFFGISPREAAQMDPQHRLFLETAVEAVDHAGLRFEALAGRGIGVFLGIASNDYAWLPESLARAPDLHAAIGGGTVFAANRLSHCFDLRGPSLAVDTTCSSSLVAAHLACRSLRQRESEVAIVGGVNLIFSSDVAAATAQSIPIAGDGLCKAFAADADGAVRGEGCVVLVLKRFAEAWRDGDTVLATILGSAVNHDGRASALTAPNPQAQTEVILAACADASVTSARLAYLEAHGTGTELGDAIEIEAAAQALRAGGPRMRPCGLGSIKAQIGHLEAAAGSAGLLRAALSLGNGRITRHPLRGAANPLISIHRDTLDLATTERPLGGGDLVGVSSFSLGGTNAHMILGAAPAPARVSGKAVGIGVRRSHIVAASARSVAALGGQIGQLTAALDRAPLSEASIADIAHTTHARRSQHRLRKAFVAEDRADLRRQLIDAGSRPALRKPRAERVPADRLLFVFPGHGAQWAGMARGLLGSEPAFTDAVRRIGARFSRYLDWSVAEFLETGADDAKMASAAHGQPALLTVELALAALLEARGVRPYGAIGYSAGELAAMVVTGMIDESEAVRIAALRARGVGEAGEGGMLAIRLPVEGVRRIAADVPDLAIAAVCGPETTIVSGSHADIRRLTERLDRIDVLALDAGVPYAFHHPAMRERVKRLMHSVGIDAAAWREPRLPLYSSALGRPVRLRDINDEYWIAAACATLRFDHAVTAALQDGFQALLEVSPAAVLTGDARELIRERNSNAIAMATLRKGIADARALALTAGELYEAGCIDDLAPFSAGGGKQVELPHYAWDRRSFWWSALPGVAGDGSGRAASGETSHATAPEEKIYRLAWTSEPADLPDATGIDIAGLDDRCAERATDAGLDAYALREQEIDAICALFARRALAELGAADAGVFTIEGIARDHGFAERQRRLLASLCRMAEADGLIVANGGGWAMQGPDPATDLQQALAGLARDLPGARHELALLGRCGPRIADVLRGSTDALTLIFPGGDAAAAAAIFSESGISSVMNALVADAVAGFARGRGSGAPLRVLEIGAGTGGTTRALRALLDRDNISYCCTDISRSLLRQTALHFPDWRGFETRRLDIAGDPLAQGFAAASYDLIVCANVLHATPDIAGALAQVRRLLARAGALVLLEATSAQRIIDLTFGLTSDWWGFADSALRPDHPLLARDRWLEQLSAAGFGECTALPGRSETAARLGATVFLANTPDAVDTAEQHAERILLLGPRDEICQAVAAQLEQAGSRVDIRPRMSRDDPEPPESWSAIIDLRWLSLRSDERSGAGTLLEDAEPLFAGLFELARILAGCARVPARLIFVTCEAVAAADHGALADPLQAASRAAIEALADEHPDWPIMAMDCSPVAPEALGAAIRRALKGTARMSFAVWRGRRRRTPALARVTERRVDAGDVRLDPQKTHVVTGGLGALGLEISEWLVRRGARHLVLAQRRTDSVDAAERLDSLRLAGAAIDIVPVDLANPEGAAAFAAGVARSKRPVGGIIYAAGVFEDGLLLNQDWTRFASVLGAKAVGAWELHRAFAMCDLDYLIYCSSAAGLLGPAGLSNYVAANAFLAALAERARRQGIAATCIAWGGWSGLGMAARQNQRWLERWQERGINGLGRDDLCRVLDWAVAGHAPANVLVADVAWDRCFEHLPAASQAIVSGLVADRRDAGLRPAEPGEEKPRETLNLRVIADPLERRERIRNEVRQRCLNALELPPHFNLEADMPLADLGLDSLLALELRAQLCSVFGLNLPQTLLFDCPSAAAITAHVVSVCETSGAEG
jgi:microcystin synthetase protein McyG